MKTILKLLAVCVCVLLFVPEDAVAQWSYNGTHIYNTNSGNVGIGNNAPATLLHVAKNMTEPSITVQNLGGIGGATYTMMDNVSGANWKFKATNAGGFKIRDHAMGLDVFTIEKNALADALYIKLGGNVGIGTNNPLEKLHVNGAVLIGNTVNTNTDTIRFNGSNFQGYNGSAWINLDLQQDNDWMIQPNIPVGNPELVPMLPPASITIGFPGLPNPNARLYLTDVAAPGIFPHLLALETMTGGMQPTLDASQLFRISSGLNPPFIDYSLGIYGPDGTFKLCNNFLLSPTAQGDNSTLLRAYPTGIVDFPNQSRARAYQVLMAGMGLQMILPGVWTPVNFILDSPAPVGFDEQNEFVLAPAANMPAPIENAFFQASVEGYYQVNARCEFNTMSYESNPFYPQWPGGPVQVANNSYVAIAIYTGPAPGATASIAVGNQLQIGYAIGPGEAGILNYNNAPNVSDVVYLQAGQIISIWVYHTALTPMDLQPSQDRVYVSIDKVG